MSEGRPDFWQTLIATAGSLTLIGLLGWMEMPPWQRELIKAAARRKTRLLLHRLARASGHRAMGDELAGRRSEADAGYSFTERLSRLRDRV